MYYYSGVTRQQKQALAKLVQQRFSVFWEFFPETSGHPEVTEFVEKSDENYFLALSVISNWAFKMPGKPIDDMRQQNKRLPKRIQDILVYDILDFVFGQPLEFWGELIETEPDGDILIEMDLDDVAHIFATWAKRLPGDVWHTALPQL